MPASILIALFIFWNHNAHASNYVAYRFIGDGGARQNCQTCAFATVMLGIHKGGEVEVVGWGGFFIGEQGWA